MTDALLTVEDLHTYLGDSHIIQGVSLNVPAGKVIALLGRNGAGKTTTLRSIMRMVPPGAAAISAGCAHSRLRGRGSLSCRKHAPFFPSLTVEENLAIAVRSVAEGGWTMERIFHDFPNLAARRRNSGTQLSGGGSRCWR